MSGVGASERTASQGHPAADLGGQVASAEADHAATPTPQRSSRLIASCAPVPAAATTADRSGLDHVGEAEADSAEHRGARARSHHQPAERSGRGP